MRNKKDSKGFETGLRWRSQSLFQRKHLRDHYKMEWSWFWHWKERRGECVSARRNLVRKWLDRRWALWGNKFILYRVWSQMFNVWAGGKVQHPNSSLPSWTGGLCAALGRASISRSSERKAGDFLYKSRYPREVARYCFEAQALWEDWVTWT